MKLDYERDLNSTGQLKILELLKVKQDSSVWFNLNRRKTPLTVEIIYTHKPD